jgi:hypothetical protein
MLKDVQFCRLVEQFDVVRKGYLIEKDDIKWNNEFLPKLRNFCEHFHSMVSETV